MWSRKLNAGERLKRYWGNDAVEDKWLEDLDEALSGSVLPRDVDTLERQLLIALDTVKQLKEGNADD